MLKWIIGIIVALIILIVARGIYEIVRGSVRLKYLVQSDWWSDNISFPILMLLVFMCVWHGYFLENEGD